MRNTLALIGAAVVPFGGLGWYLDWFKLMNSPAPSGHHSLNIDIDTVKITEDLHRGSVKVQEALDKTKREAEAKAKGDDAKAAQPEVKKSVFEEGGEAEDE